MKRRQIRNYITNLKRELIDKWYALDEIKRNKIQNEINAWEIVLEYKKIVID